MKRTSVPMGVVSTRAKIVPGEAEGVVAAQGPRQHQCGLGAVVAVTAREGEFLLGSSMSSMSAIEIDPTEPDTGQRAPVGKVLEG